MQVARLVRARVQVARLVQVLAQVAQLALARVQVVRLVQVLVQVARLALALLRALAEHLPHLLLRQLHGFAPADLEDTKRYPWLKGVALIDFVDEWALQHEMEHLQHLLARPPE